MSDGRGFVRCVGSSLLLLLFVCLQSAKAATGSSASFTPQFEYFVDSAGDMRIEAIARLSDERFRKAPEAGYVAGYSRSAHWLRFSLSPSEMVGETLILRIKPAYTDYITLYQPDRQGGAGFKVTQGGERTADLSGRFDRALVFELRPVQRTSTFYLRVETENTITVVAQIYPRQAYMQAVGIDHLIAGLFVGLLITLIALNSSYQTWRKDQGFRYYIIFVFASLLVFLSVDGWLLLFLPAHLKPLLVYMPQLTTLFYLMSVAVFYHTLFGFHRQTRPVCYWLSKCYQALIVLGALSLASGYYVEYIPWFMNLSVVYLGWVGLIALNRVVRQAAEGRALLLAVVMGFLGILGTALSLSGLVSGGVWLLYSYTIGTLASILIFQGIMSRRLRQNEQKHLATLLEKEHAEILVERERKDKEQKAQFISMLSHELKTPLSVISMGVSQPEASAKMRGHVLQAVSDMGRVIDRCAVLDQMDNQVHTRKEAVELIGLVDSQVEQARATDRARWLSQQKELWVSSDTDWLRVILSNLIDNALKYSPPDSVIELNQHSGPGRVCLKISNLTHEQLPDSRQLFDKYYRAQSARKQTGAGLGLYIVQCLVTQLGGHIDYEVMPVPEQSAYKVVMRLCLPDLQ